MSKQWFLFSRNTFFGLVTFQDQKNGLLERKKNKKKINSIFASPKNDFFFKESFLGFASLHYQKIHSFKNNIINLQVQKMDFFSRTLFFCLMSSKGQKTNTLRRKKWKRIHFVLNEFIFWSCKFKRPKIGILGKNYLLDLQKWEFFFSSNPYFGLASFWSCKLAKTKYGFWDWHWSSSSSWSNLKKYCQL